MTRITRGVWAAASSRAKGGASPPCGRAGKTAAVVGCILGAQRSAAAAVRVMGRGGRKPTANSNVSEHTRKYGYIQQVRHALEGTLDERRGLRGACAR